MRRSFLFIAYILCSVLGKAQDVHFSQYDMAPVFVNPAQAGHFDGYLRANLNYKDQWGALDGYRTGAFSADLPLLRSKWDGGDLGIGTYVYQDKAGKSEMGRFEAGLALSGIIELSSTMKLSAGMSGVFAQRSITVDGLAWDSQFDGTGYNSSLATNETFGNAAFSYFDLGTGIFWSYKRKESSIAKNDGLKFNVGAAYHHVTEPDQMFYASTTDQLNSKLAVHFRGDIGIPSTHFSVIPMAAYFSQGPMQEVIFGSLFEYRIKSETNYTGFARESAVSFGMLMRLNDALIPVVRYRMADFELGISYDLNISSLSPATSGRGGFEIGLTYRDVTGALFGKSASRAMMD